VIRIGTAGWSLPKALAADFLGEGSHLQRYAARLNAVEINSSFYRPHRRITYKHWAASVPDGFRFAVKLPRTITHDRRFVDCEALVAQFADESGGLGDKCGPVLVQLPPSFPFAAELAGNFFAMLGRVLPGQIACEPRHPSWFDDGADGLLAAHGIARVAADPAPVPAAARPGGSLDLDYLRLHGSPEMYRSSYNATAIAAHIRAVHTASQAWVIYDNTALGAALPNALALLDLARD